MTGSNVAVVLGHSRGGMLNTDIGFSTAVEGLLGDLEKVGSLAGIQSDRREGIRRAALTLLRKRYPFRTAENAIGTMTSRLAGLISSTFRLSGRHMVVDAACASSFAALEIAVRALRQGSVDLALSGGVSYSQEMSMVLFSQARALSSEGSFPFDETASGFISSDGVGIVVLERLDDAMRHGRRILGLIRGIALV
jgi:acyl transferase domain-containing protein